MKGDERNAKNGAGLGGGGGVWTLSLEEEDFLQGKVRQWKKTVFSKNAGQQGGKANGIRGREELYNLKGIRG